MYGPVRTVVWQGSAGDRRPYADHWGSYAQQGCEALLQHDYDTLDRVRARVRTSRVGAQFTGAYRGKEMFRKLVEVLAPHQIAVIKPKIAPAA